jgi:hypothetical protein
MADIKDIMGMSRGGPATEKQEKPKEQKLVKPKGMSRYVFDRSVCSLLGVCIFFERLKFLQSSILTTSLPHGKFQLLTERLLPC